MRVFKFLQFCAIILALIVYESKADTSMWFTGSGGLGSYSGFSGTASLSGGLQLNRFVGQIYMSKTKESDFFERLTHKNPITHNYSYGLLGGVSIIKNEWIHFFSTCGISYMQGVRRGELISVVDTIFLLTEETYQFKSFSVLNIPININVSFIKLTYFGVGAILQANINKEFQDIALSFALHFGKLR